MKNICASVGAIPTHRKKEEATEEVEEEYHQMENEMIFCLKEDPEYQISAVAEWGENSRGDIVVGADTYFRHIITGKRCGSVWDAVDGYVGFDTRWADDYENLASHIEDIADIEKIVRTERSVEL